MAISEVDVATPRQAWTITRLRIAGRLNGVDAETAKSIALEQVIEPMASSRDMDLVVTEVRRISRTWVVSYQTRVYWETREISHALAGNGPVLVSEDGRVGRGGTGEPPEHYVAEFERSAPN